MTGYWKVFCKETTFPVQESPRFIGPLTGDAILTRYRAVRIGQHAAWLIIGAAADAALRQVTARIRSACGQQARTDGQDEKQH